MLKVPPVRTTPRHSFLVSFLWCVGERQSTSSTDFTRKRTIRQACRLGGMESPAREL